MKSRFAILLFIFVFGIVTIHLIDKANKEYNKVPRKQVYIDSGPEAPLLHKYIPPAKPKISKKEPIGIQVKSFGIGDDALNKSTQSKLSTNAERPVVIANKKLNGYANYCWANGDCYTGYWKSGYMNGGGAYIWKDGIKCIDTFINGTPIHNEFEDGDKRYRIIK